MTLAQQVTALDPRLYRHTPWKNGGGVTIDIADAYEAGAEPGSWHGMIWRFGRTSIVRPGPFSDLSGQDRILTVVGGHGLVLEVEGREALDARAPFRPVRFPGEWRITSRLEAGPVEVVNLMADRRQATIDVVVLGPDAAIPPGIHVVYAAKGDAVVAMGEEAFALSEDHALRIDTPHPGHVAARSGRPLLASVMLR